MSEPVQMTAEVAAALRLAFAPTEVGKLPKMFCRACSQSQAKTCEQHPRKNKCGECGGFHSAGTLHLDYIGHAEATDRLLAVDPAWDWEPLALTAEGRPAFDNNGGLWIRLTIAGVSRIGYGDAPGKSGGNAVKEAIGDAIRNAAMRFGVGLDLWRKTERAETDAAVADPGPADPDGRIIGRGDHRVDRDEWQERVAAAARIRPYDAAEDRLKVLWSDAGGDPAMEQAVRRAVEQLRLEKAAAAEAAAKHEEEKIAALAAHPPAAEPDRKPAAPAEPDPIAEQQAAEWDAKWREKLEAAVKEKDAPTIRALIKLARENNSPELKREGTIALDMLRSGA